MDPTRPDLPHVEVLDTGRPPGVLERWLRTWSFAGKVASASAVALLTGGGWFVLASHGPAAEDDVSVDEAPVVAPGLRPPPARGREAGSGSWRVSQDVSIRSGPRGHTITFFAANKGTEPQDPARFRVAAGFVDREGLDYRATCAAVRLTSRGYRPRTSLVQPDEEVFVRCTDTTRYGRAVAWIDPKSVVVSTEPCEESRSLPGV